MKAQETLAGIAQSLTIWDAVEAGIPVGLTRDGYLVTIPSEPHGRCDNGHALETIGGTTYCPECSEVA